MTAQLPDALLNEHPRIKFGKLRIYRVLTGDIRSLVSGDLEARKGRGEEYQFESEPEPPTERPFSTGLRRGYTSTFRLHPNGNLELIEYDFWLPSGQWHAQKLSEPLKGDFWLEMARSWGSPRTYVRFRDGIIDEDFRNWKMRSHWLRRQTNYWLIALGIGALALSILLFQFKYYLCGTAAFPTSVTLSLIGLRGTKRILEY